MNTSTEAASEPATDAAASDESLVCSGCGTTPRPEDRSAARLTWSRGADAGRTTWTCERCSRENLRSIESKLDPVWW
ncbi:hypothetical protein ASH01_02020 [Terrabacter sp. Soil811]|uniref:hypothetical protein n=1 Tax=Terrabacter sp. Soil811 TaxID=1736419 RepID=UPI0006FFC45E|nr:hypothetical protein [Terrabacter sp. Soil811]KRF48496.1 hypothetical protein ASH01_02020 [Terrabacter sp. Soil811]